MSSANNSGERKWRIAEWFPELNSEIITQLRAYLSELIYFNGRMNLISPRTEANADMLHIADGLLGARSVFSMTNAQEIYDIGSGNGVPGIIMAILDKNRLINLVDADARKIEFLKHCVARLSLSNCYPTQARLEDLPEASIHCAVSRAFASISKTLLFARRAAAPDCEYFHFKGRSWATEVGEIPSQILASWDPKHVCDYMLPTSETTMSIVVTKRNL